MQLDCLQSVVERDHREIERGTNNTVERLYAVMKGIVDDVKRVVRSMSCGRPTNVDLRHRTEYRRVP